MECGICGNKTSYDTSYGMREFVICRNCYRKLRKKESCLAILDQLNEIGDRIRVIKEKALTDNPKVI